MQNYIACCDLCVGELHSLHDLSDGPELAVTGTLEKAAEKHNGIKRLDVLGNLTNKFMRTYTMQVEALARKRRKGEQNIKVKHVHVYAGGRAIVGNVSHRGGRGVPKK